MPRRPTPLSADDGPQARFALALRQLRDEAGFDAKSIDSIAAGNHIPRSTLYAALRGERIPTVPVLGALVRAWGGDEVEWRKLRTETETLAERARLQSARPKGRELTAVEVEQSIARGKRIATDIMGRVGNVQMQKALMEVARNDAAVLADLRRHRRYDDVQYWTALRRLAGAPTVREISNGTTVSQSDVARVLKAVESTPRRTRLVCERLVHLAEARIARWTTVEPLPEGAQSAE
ncbi:hypothetical protein [Streptomyces sp. NPDC095817]|uniref:hypothetical protein n=1 Tax=Streptomyces sp. NPDC095817 TaxID=3155082 RepID=UPI00332EF2C9